MHTGWSSTCRGGAGGGECIDPRAAARPPHEAPQQSADPRCAAPRVSPIFQQRLLVHACDSRTTPLRKLNPCPQYGDRWKPSCHEQANWKHKLCKGPPYPPQDQAAVSRAEQQAERNRILADKEVNRLRGQLVSLGSLHHAGAPAQPQGGSPELGARHPGIDRRALICI